MNTDPVIELLRDAEPPGGPVGPIKALAMARSARRRRRAGSAGSIVLASAIVAGALTVSWGSDNHDSVVPAAAPAPPFDHGYAPATPLVEKAADKYAPLTVPARARSLLECVGQGQVAVGENPAGEVSDKPDAALGAFVRAFDTERAWIIPQAHYRRAGTDKSRALYTIRKEDRVVAAIIAAKSGTGWKVASYGFCPEPLPRSYQVGPPLSTWTDAAGRPVDDEKVHSYVGSGHCNYESIVALTLNAGPTYDTPERRDFVRDPEGVLARIGKAMEDHGPVDEMYRGWTESQHRFDAYATLPPQATDTGYRRGGSELWVDDTAAYLVGPNRTERWPEVGEGPLCH